MKNFEKYEEIILRHRKFAMGCEIKRLRTGMLECEESCANCFQKSIEWLYEEYIQPIKLTKFEFDLIDTNNMPHDRTFESFATYKNMRERGYFRGVYDVDLTLKEILENCEIVEAKDE